MKIVVRFAVFVCLVCCCSNKLTAANAPKKEVAIRFCAMGDLPYVMSEWQLLEEQVRELPDDIDFVVHLGDIKRGVLPCFEPNYKRVAEILGKSKSPAFIVLGDNEWNDCLRPEVGLTYWKRHLLRLDERWKHGLNVSHDATRDENFAFVKKGVLVIGINLVGGRILDKDEWKARHKGNARWIEQSLEAAKRNGKITSMVILGHARPTKDHDDFFKPFAKIADDFDKPVLYLHGDGHSWEVKKDFKKKNITRVQVDQGAKGPPVLITVETSGKKPFDFDRRGAGKKKD